MQMSTASVTLFAALLAIVAWTPASAFTTSSPSVFLRQPSALAGINARPARLSTLRMQEEPPKQTTGFGKFFKGISAGEHLLL
eukprot:2117232-Rhodomonas_salina.1